MSRSLFLVRHAQSADKQSGQTDHARELAPAGRAQATALGLFLQEQKYFFDLVICSTAIRTKQTLEHILSVAKSLHIQQIVFEESFYHGSHRDYYNRVVQVDAQFRSVLIVGHNPSISELSASLVQRQAFQNFLPCSFAELQFSEDEWSTVQENTGQLITFKNPTSK